MIAPLLRFSLDESHQSLKFALNMYSNLKM